MKKFLLGLFAALALTASAEVDDNGARIQYIASASQTAFDYPFEITAEADLDVYVNGTLQALTTNYTITGEGEDDGGTVTFVTGRSSGDIVTLIRDTAIERTTSFGQNGPMTSANMNREFDKLFVIAQELENDFGRTLHLPATVEAVSADFEIDPANYANKYLSFDENGVPTPADLTISGVITQAIVGEALFPRTAGESGAGVTPTDYQWPAGHLLRYNDAASGVDASTALQQAISSSDVVTIPAGTFPIANVNLRTGVRIECQPGAILQRVSTSTLITNSAATTGNRITGCTFDANNSYTNPVMSFTVGTNDFDGDHLTFTNFDNGTSGATLMSWSGTNATPNRDIALHYIVAEETGTAAENYASITIANPVNVTVEHSRFVNAGSVQTFFSTTYTTAAGPVRIADNYFEGINSSTVLVRVNGANILQGVSVENNDCVDQSPSLNKYCFTIGQHQTATSGGIVRGVRVADNWCRGSSDTFDGCILLGDTGLGLTEGSGAVVEHNVADFTESDGSIDTSGNTTQRGIWISDWDGAVVTGNYVRGSQSAAYILSDSSRITFTGNVAVESLRNASAAAGEACYYLAQATISAIMFDGNYAIDCGGGGASHAGFASANSSSITNLAFGTNHAIDTRGSPAMVYGYNIGTTNTGVNLSRSMFATGFTTAAINGAGINTAFASTDATPSVINRTLTYNTANGSATTITNFDDGSPGQEIFVVVADSNTTLDCSSNANIRCNGDTAGNDWTPNNGDHFRCTRFSTTWYCTTTQNTP